MSIKVFTNRTVWAVGAMLALAAFMAGCGKPGPMGVEVPADGEVVALAKVLASPRAWDGKKVVLEGEATWVCPSLCEFTFTEGRDSVTVFPRDMELKGLKKGMKIRVLATVKAGKERVLVSSLGIEPR